MWPFKPGRRFGRRNFNAGLFKYSRFYKLSYLLSKIVFALFCAGILGFVYPQVLGGGNELLNNIAKTPLHSAGFTVVTAGKFIFTIMLSYLRRWCPGGFFRHAR